MSDTFRAAQARSDAIEEQMELIFAGKKSPKQGLDDAVAKSRDILKEFAALYK